jgi:Fe2+ or Zn2+ uptake regulation protein
MQEVRWKQRLENFKVVFMQLENAVQVLNYRSLNDLEKLGFIHVFEFTFGSDCY